MILRTVPNDRSAARHRTRRWLLAAWIGVSPWSVAWAAHDFITPPPSLPVPVVVKVRPHPDLPKYAVPGPKSDMVLGFDNSVGLGIAFGALGVAAAAATQGNAGDANLAGLPSIALLEPTRSVVESWAAGRASQGRFIFGGGDEAGGPMLELVPLAILSFTDRERRTAQAFVELRASLMDGQKRVLWRTRYVASTGGIRPISGDSGWAARQGAALTATMDASLRAGLRFLLQDLVTPASRTAGKQINTELHVPRQDKAWKFEGQAIAEDGSGYVLIASREHDAHVTGGFFVLEGSRLGSLSGLPKPRMAESNDAPVPSLPVAGQAAIPAAPVTPEANAETSRRPRVITAAEVDGHTWRYAHPRDPARFGEVRLVFRDGRVDASNARGKAHGRYELRNGKLCITYDADSWPASCLTFVEGTGGAPMLWTNTFARELPLIIE